MSQRILVVDDSLTVRMDLTDAFQEAGFEVTGAASVAEARDAAFGDGCALVLLDVQLPDGSGVDLLAELKADARTAEIPVVLLSSHAEVEDRIRGLRTGADEYVGKPYDATRVVARARELIHASGLPQDTRQTILVIDDSRTFRETLRETLEAHGYRAEVAASPEEGLRRAAILRPTGVIVDGRMEGMDGTEVIRRIRQDRALSATPCLLITGSQIADSEIAALDAGADSYVSKAEDLELAMTRLRAMLRSASASSSALRTSSLMGPKRVLAVDDSRTYLHMLAEHLRQEAYEPVLASSGEEALSLLAVQPVDCILLDLIMPGLSGTETCRRIKSDPEHRNVPVIILTAREELDSMIAGIEAGADDYITKSGDFGVLLARLRAQLRRKQFEDENRRIREQLLSKDAEAREARARAEAKAELLSRLEESNRQLEHHARELESLNRELEMFAYSVSHDLRQPLRAMDGFSRILLRDHAESLDDTGRHYLERVRASADRMNRLIDGLLLLSRMGRRELRPRRLRLDAIACAVVERLRETDPDREVDVTIDDGLTAHGDRHLVESILENLLGNAWKFTRDRRPAHIEVGCEERDGERAFFVRDDGAGFDMEYADKLFAPFQRLHSERQFEGTGIGLATVQRIVHRHGGRVWAEAAPGRGATIHFSLGAIPPHDSGREA